MTMPVRSHPAIRRPFIDGRPAAEAGRRTFPSINPATGAVLAEVEHATRDDLEAGHRRRRAGPGRLGRPAARERGRVMMRAVALLRERNDALAHLDEPRHRQADRRDPGGRIATGADVLEYYAGLAAAIEGRQIPLRENLLRLYAPGGRSGSSRASAPGNYPIQIALWKSAPGAGGGQRHAVQAERVTPLSALVLAEIYTEAGLARRRVSASCRARRRDRRLAHRASGGGEGLVHRRHR